VISRDLSADTRACTSRRIPVAAGSRVPVPILCVYFFCVRGHDKIAGGETPDQWEYGRFALESVLKIRPLNILYLYLYLYLNCVMMIADHLP
jgi:hypothetical protein